MNLTTAIMLVNKGVRPVRVLYDPDNPGKSYNPHQLFKTLDPELKKDDYVIVPTGTRHGFTVAKVVEVGFRVDLSGGIDQFGWVVGKVDTTAYEHILSQEKIVTDRMGEAEENRMRAELSKAMGLEDIKFDDLDVVKGTQLPAPSTIRGAGVPAETPSAEGMTKLD